MGIPKQPPRTAGALCRFLVVALSIGSLPDACGLRAFSAHQPHPVEALARPSVSGCALSCAHDTATLGLCHLLTSTTYASQCQAECDGIGQGELLVVGSCDSIPKELRELSYSLKNTAAELDDVSEVTAVRTAPRILVETPTEEHSISENEHASTAAEDTSADHDSGGHGGDHHVHSYTVILYLFFMVVLGCLTSELLKRYHIPVPYTVLLLIEGLIIGIIHRESDGGLKTLGDSIDMWVHIDAHLLLYAFLPALIFGDAMGIDTHMMYRCFSQCFLLACPGVLLGAFLTATVAKYVLPYSWDWNMALMLGSIVGATDPVAVVALLGELGASPKLTMLISGESLMNDGTAVVMFSLFYQFVMGSSKNAGGIVEFFLQMAVGGPVVGACFGLLVLLLFAYGKVKGNQISYTIALAYLSFYVAEGEAGMSGVLSVFVAALVIAHAGWPYVSEHEAMHALWHSVEFLGNTVVFLLAGTIMGDFFVGAHQSNNIEAADWGWLLVLYAAVNLIRLVMLALFFPILKRMGYGLDWREAAVMTWGGLRGAVGLALGIAVLRTDDVDDQGNRYVSEKDGQRVLFMVAGVALLTLLVNATTTGQLLRRLGLLDQTPARIAVLAQVVEDSNHELLENYEKYKQRPHFQGINEKLLVRALHKITIESLRHMPKVMSLKWRKSVSKVIQQGYQQSAAASAPGMHELRRMYTSHHLVQMNRMLNKSVLVCMRELYLDSVRAHYWERIEDRIIPPGMLSQILISSIDYAKDKMDQGLNDWEFVSPYVKQDHNSWLTSLQTLPLVIRRWKQRKDVQEYSKWSVAVQLAGAFADAHAHAWHHVCENYEDMDQTGSEFVLLRQEHDSLVERAEHFLKSASMARSSVISEIRTRQLAALLTAKHQNHIEEKQKEGILTTKMAHELMRVCRNAFHHAHLDIQSIGQSLHSFDEPDGAPDEGEEDPTPDAECVVSLPDQRSTTEPSASVPGLVVVESRPDAGPSPSHGSASEDIKVLDMTNTNGSPPKGYLLDSKSQSPRGLPEPLVSNDKPSKLDPMVVQPHE